MDREYYKKWREQHREERKQYEKQYREQHKAKIKNYQKEYSKAHKLEKREYDKIYRNENREKYRAYFKEYRIKNKEILRGKREADIKEKIRNPVHRKLNWYLRKNKIIRPTKCTICWCEWKKIVAHHPNYDEWYNVVFCCESCHRDIHGGFIKNINTINILHINQ